MNLKTNIMNFFNSITPKKDKPTVINQDKELGIVKKEVQKWMSEKGHSIAENLVLDKDQSFELNLFPPIVFIRELHQSKLNEVGAIYDKNLSIRKTIYNKYESEFEVTNEAHSDIEDLEAERIEVLEEAFNDHKNEIEDKKEEAEDLKTEIKNNKTELKSLTKHNLLPLKITASGIMLLMVLGEVYLNKDAFSYAGFAETATTFIGIAIATVTFMLGMAKSSIIRKQDWSLPIKITSSLGLFLLVASVYFVLGTIRVSLLESQGENDGIFGLSPFHFIAFNLAFYIGIFACKFFIYPNPQMLDDNDKHKIALAKLSENEKKLKVLKNVIFKGYQAKDKKRKEVQKQYDIRINPIKETIKIENDAIKKSALDFNSELALARNFYKQINADYKTRVADLLNTLNLFGNNKDAQVLMTNIDDLQNPFEHIKLITIKTTVTPVISTNGTSELEKTAWETLADSKTNYSFINNSKS